MSIVKRIFIILVTLACGTFFFTCLMHMAIWESGAIVGSIILAVWGMVPLVLFIMVPDGLSSSRIFAAVHLLLFLALTAVMVYMAYDLTYVHIDALNSIGFITVPFLAIIPYAAFYALSILIHSLTHRAADAELTTHEPLGLRSR
ncbi:MAG: hypothetical protein CMJ49_07585 [Planctomycetaceae bacterium]|nr:hypothetical protein [Planctomycetaceae bacterium]